jgi:hypothetical protein
LHALKSSHRNKGTCASDPSTFHPSPINPTAQLTINPAHAIGREIEEIMVFENREERYRINKLV